MSLEYREMLLSEIFGLNERLTDADIAKVATWEPRTSEATAATDHFFGKGVEDKYTKLPSSEGKSTVHKSIEQYLGRQISEPEYKTGQLNVGMGKPTVKIGKALQKKKAPVELMRGFENDTTRQGKKFENLTVRTTRSAVGIAGQTSKCQSWERGSCKNFYNGVSASVLKDEVQHGTVVHYLQDEKGTELARATSQPHINDAGITMYATDAYYGIPSPAFKKYVEQTNEKLSGEHIGGNMYVKHPKVMNDNRQKVIFHHSVTTKDIDDVLATGDVETVNGLVMSKYVTPEQIVKILKSNNWSMRLSVAQSPAANENVLLVALDDSNYDVRIAAAENENATAKVIDKVLADEDPNVRGIAVFNKATTPEQFDRLFKDESEVVRGYVAKSRRVSKGQLSQLLKDESRWVRADAIRNNKTTREQIEPLKYDKESIVRNAVDERLAALKKAETK